jgi:hypothetical protein
LQAMLDAKIPVPAVVHAEAKEGSKVVVLRSARQHAS